MIERYPMSLRAALHKPRDLFEKLRRDADLLREAITSDRFFNFVVTAHSLNDWVKSYRKVFIMLRFGRSWIGSVKRRLNEGSLACAWREFTSWLLQLVT